MSRAAIMPTLGVGKRGRVGCFLLIIVLIAPEDILESTGDVRRPPFTALAVRENQTWGAVETIAAMTTRTSSQPTQ
jgi:hypothetical protein